MTAEEDLGTYLDGTDPAAVAEAARRLDRTAREAGQISADDLRYTLAQSDEEIVAERDAHRAQDLAARRAQGLAGLLAIRAALDE